MSVGLVDAMVDGLCSAGQPHEETAISPYLGDRNSAARPVPIFEAAFKNDMWWSIPEEDSLKIYQQYIQGNNASYVWDWGESRTGSYAPEGEETTYNRYIIDFDKWEQCNLDSGTRRSVRLVFVQGGNATATATGHNDKKRNMDWSV